MTSYVYALVDPDTGETRYVGRAKNTQQRLIEHILEGRITPKRLWLVELESKNKQPILTILEEVTDNEKEREKYWIQQKISEGNVLLNIQLAKERKPAYKPKDIKIKASTIKEEDWNKIKPLLDHGPMTIRDISIALDCSRAIARRFIKKVVNHFPDVLEIIVIKTNQRGRPYLLLQKKQQTV